jgi:hypothetical protein
MATKKEPRVKQNSHDQNEIRVKCLKLHYSATFTYQLTKKQNGRQGTFLFKIYKKKDSLTKIEAQET